MPVATPVETATVEFNKDQLIVGKDTDIRTGLSAVVLDGPTLWLACDEGCRLESVTAASGSTFTNHKVFALDGLLDLPAESSEEADIEGLDVDGGFLWLVGSHAVKRKKAKVSDAAQAIADKLKDISRDGNRHLLARIPLHDGGLVRQHDGRRAARIDANKNSSQLLDAISRPTDLARRDDHLAAFVPLPSKDNGFDIEGLAVRGSRAFIGLRGPVLREWCCILEVAIDDAGDRLVLAPLDGDRPYRKHFLKLNGLGVRDLMLLDDDVVILAGPTMAHDGPSEIWRWKNGAKAGAPGPASDAKRVLSLPQRDGVDRPEGFSDVERTGGSTSVLVVFDTPAPERLVGPSGVRVDIFRF